MQKRPHEPAFRQRREAQVGASAVDDAAMNRLRSWARFAPLPLTVKLMAVNILLVVSLAAVVLVAWRMLPAEADAAADVILLTNAQRANQNADMLHDALRSDALASLLAGQAPGITADTVRQSLRTHAQEFRAEVARLNKMPLKAEARQYVVEAYISALHYVALAEQHVELGLTDRTAALAEIPSLAWRRATYFLLRSVSYSTIFASFK